MSFGSYAPVPDFDVSIATPDMGLLQSLMLGSETVQPAIKFVNTGHIGAVDRELLGWIT